MSHLKMMPSLFILLVIFFIQKLFWVWFGLQSRNHRKNHKMLNTSVHFSITNKITCSIGLHINGIIFYNLYKGIISQWILRFRNTIISNLSLEWGDLVVEINFSTDRQGESSWFLRYWRFIGKMQNNFPDYDKFSVYL